MSKFGVFWVAIATGFSLYIYYNGVSVSNETPLNRDIYRDEVARIQKCNIQYLKLHPDQTGMSTAWPCP